VIDLSAAVEYRIFTLSDPYRVVIDLPEISWRLPPGAPASGVGLIATYRYGLFKPGTSRVVLDVKGPVAVASAFVLPPAEGRQYRLVLDLKAVSRDEFERLARAGPPPPPSVEDRPEPEPPAAARRPDDKRVVVIDPGHGGVDPGAVGASGIPEKDITLAMARDLKKEMEATGRYKVVLTRDRDIFVRLRKRIAIARAAGAELFISLHADSIGNPAVRGASVYTLSEKASDKEAALLAAKENKVDIIAGIDLSNELSEVTGILIDLAQRETMNDSVLFASMLVVDLRREIDLLHKSHRFAGFAVLKAPDVPSVLFELGYLSNRKEEQQLRSPRHRAKIIAAVLRAADRYFAETDRLRTG
jgi:N-acetylmuramoyl-L-alanine amidase